MTYFLLLLLCSQVAQANEKNSGKKPNKSKLELGVSFAPSVAFRTLRLVAHTPASIHNLSDLISNQAPIYGHDIRFNFLYHFDHVFSLQTGLGYSIKGYQYVYTGGYIVAGKPYKARSSQAYEYHYISIPLLIRVSGGEKRVRFSGSAGIEAEFLWADMDISPQIIQHNGSSGSKHFHVPAQDSRAGIFNISAIASAGIEYQVTEKVGTRIAPFFSHQCLPFTKGDINTYLWAAGIDFTFFFGVK